MKRTPGIMPISSLATCLMLLQACSGIGAISGDMPLKVESDPAGATVHILGKAVGTTPITISQQQLYPPGYNTTSHQKYGTLSFSKEGCESLTKQIHYRNFSTGVSVDLECKETTTITEQPGVSSAPPPISKPSSNEALPGVSEATDSAAKPKAPASATQPTQRMDDDIADKQVTGLSIKQRLLRIEKLKREGMISEAEYQQARKRILDEL